MFKKILSVALLSVSALTLGAQTQVTPMPLNPAVKHGTLPNGLNYYILHNEEPKERANFYIAQKVGSTLETPEQLGLAHFLEHMAFNGTKNYPGKSMLNYLQSKGIRFGSDINAYTGFDETVYRINNVPTTDKALMDSVLLVLHDWSGSILLEEDEINAERGVIEEEWRSRNNAQQRMFEAMLPVIYKEYQYQQMPIGKMEVVRNFPPQVIRDYYHKWYRPDQQGIVIVGDFDAAEMEAKVKELFSKIPMPENAAERTYPSVSDNAEPIYFYFSDKELQFPMIMVSFKKDKTPFEQRNSVENYVETSMIETLFCSMLNNRLNEYAKNADCKYAQAYASIGDFLVSKTKSAFDITIIAKNDVKGAFDDAMSIVARACKTGFAQSELVRARDELLANYEKAYNERNNTKSHTLAQEIIRHFIDNEPSPGIETEHQLAQMILKNIPVEAFNEYAKEMLTENNEVIVVSEPAKDEMTVISKEVILGSMRDALNKEYEAYVDEVITEPLIAKMPKPGKVKTTNAGQFGTTEMVLSNGAKVIIKKTDFKQDEIILTAFKKGGKVSYPESDGSNVLLAGEAYDLAKQGTFDNIKLEKYLAGKKVSLGFEIGSKATLLQGSSTVKDIKTFMELVYSSFTQLNPDEQAYNTEMDKAKSYMVNFDKDQQRVFQKMITKATYGNNPMFQPIGIELINSGNYTREFNIVKEALSNPSDYTFIFTGSIDAETLKPLLEQYIATIPSKKASKEPRDLSSISLAKGIVNDFAKFPMAAPSTIVYADAHGNNLAYNIENAVKVEMIGELLDIIFTETLREEEGGTYSPQAYSYMSPWNNSWQVIYVFQTNDQMQDKLIKRANDEFMNLLKNGTDEKNFNKVKEAAMKQYEIKIRTNSYWSNNLFRNACGYNDITNHKAAIENLTLAELNKFMSSLYDGKNHIQVVLQGVTEK